MLSRLQNMNYSTQVADLFSDRADEFPKYTVPWKSVRKADPKGHPLLFNIS